MSPILIRPVREQIEHDRIIRVLHARLRSDFDVEANLGDEKRAALRIGQRTHHPDLVLTAPGAPRKIQAVVEVETGESVNHLEAMAEWAHFGRTKARFSLYVPVSTVDIARRLVSDHGIAVAELWSYATVGDHVHFWLVQATGEGAPAPGTEFKVPVDGGYAPPPPEPEVAPAPEAAVAAAPPKGKPKPASAEQGAGTAPAAKPAKPVKPAKPAGPAGPAHQKPHEKPHEKPAPKPAAKPAPKPAPTKARTTAKPAKPAPKPARPVKPAASAKAAASSRSSNAKKAVKKTVPKATPKRPAKPAAKPAAKKATVKKKPSAKPSRSAKSRRH